MPRVETPSPKTGRAPGSFADILMREAVQGGANKAAIIDRAITKYSEYYIKGRAPDPEGLRVRAHRVIREAIAAGWVERPMSWYEIEAPEAGK